MNNDIRSAMKTQADMALKMADQITAWNLDTARLSQQQFNNSMDAVRKAYETTIKANKALAQTLVDAIDTDKADA